MVKWVDKRRHEISFRRLDIGIEDIKEKMFDDGVKNR